MIRIDTKSAPQLSFSSVNKKAIKKRSENHIDSLVMVAIQRFFDDRTYANELWNQLGDENNKDKISLRVVDWFVTNYSKKHAVHFKTSKDKTCIVWQEYKQKLRGYSKQRFDPFCRHNRIRFHLLDSKSIITTVGQLNFFRWAIENEILLYIRTNREAIEKDMNDTYQVHYSDRRRPDIRNKIERKPLILDKDTLSLETTRTVTSDCSKSRKKRREISRVANNGVCLFDLS